eukprot:TRINITY_DN7914_c0_g1_i1.p1 TRINITY_DN7914_c0_g1~~TRINITY_DN7914_c0_g1_i1.p1  ORF type:complete len:293 (+),score=58.59 TRINITY_DN7914_c0_g1_i1:91-969(+)
MKDSKTKINHNAKASLLTRNQLHKPYESFTKESTLRKSLLYNKGRIVQKSMKEKLNKSLINGKQALDNTSADIKHRIEITSVKNLNSTLWNAKGVKSAEQEVAEALRKALAGKTIDKKLEMASKLFGKLVKIDTKYGCILKEIKEVYDEKIETLAAKFPQDEKATQKSTVKPDQLEKKQRSSTRNVKHVSMKLEDSPFNKKSSSFAFSGKVINPCSSSVKPSKKHVFVPRLDLSKVKPYFENDEVVHKKTGSNNKQSELLSLNSFSEDYERNPLDKYHMKIYGSTKYPLNKK